MTDMVKVDRLCREFDVSPPWLNRVLEGKSKAILHAVNDVSFNIKKNSVYALVGESGSGKSTVGKVVVGLLPPTSGSVEIDGVDLFQERDKSKLNETRSGIQMIFQDPYASLNPRWKVGGIIVEPVEARGGNTQKDWQKNCLSRWVFLHWM